MTDKLVFSKDKKKYVILLVTAAVFTALFTIGYPNYELEKEQEDIKVAASDLLEDCAIVTNSKKNLYTKDQINEACNSEIIDELTVQALELKDADPDTADEVLAAILQVNEWREDALKK